MKSRVKLDGTSELHGSCMMVKSEKRESCGRATERSAALRTWVARLNEAALIASHLSVAWIRNLGIMAGAYENEHRDFRASRDAVSAKLGDRMT